CETRVLQLPCAGAEESAGGSYCRARPLRLLAGDHRRSRFPDRDRDRIRRQTLHRPFRTASRPQPGLACSRRRPAADRPRRRGLLTPPHRKCSATPPARRGLPLPLSYLVIRTVEDGSNSNGIAPLTNPVTLRIDSFTLPIPSGSFVS